MTTRTDVLAHRLSARIDELARALADAGATGAEAERLLEAAAIAAMHAVSLEALATEPPPLPWRAEPDAAPAALSQAA